ncbi:MAG: hypothetical protein GF387_01715, partial [Candidatus Portnoybacteria bacterium]|nr:hypothetical protein [Candidatus Portnoybacteria bacterium]
MKKKILLASLAVVAILGGVAAMSAYEAHVVNVTAKIENALSVTPDEIMFGTVFPQEAIDKNVKIVLSDSFIEEERVDDVSYYIRQKPKPRPESYTGDEPMFESERMAQEWCYENYGKGDLQYDYYSVC